MRHRNILLIIVAVAVLLTGFIIWQLILGPQNNSDTQDEPAQTVPSLEGENGLTEAEGFLNSANIDAQLKTSEIDAVLE